MLHASSLVSTGEPWNIYKKSPKGLQVKRGREQLLQVSIPSEGKYVGIIGVLSEVKLMISEDTRNTFKAKQMEQLGREKGLSGGKAKLKVPSLGLSQTQETKRPSQGAPFGGQVWSSLCPELPVRPRQKPVRTRQMPVKAQIWLFSALPSPV